VIHSLQFRLLVAFTLVILVTIGAVFFLISWGTGGEIRHYWERSEQIRIARMELVMARHYHEHGGWAGIQPFVEQGGSLYTRRIILTDASGTVVADSEGDLLGEHYQPDAPGMILKTPGGREIMGTLYITPGPLTGADATSPYGLAKTISHFLLWGGLLAIAIALVITFSLSRRILAPVKALTLTASRLGQGDFSQRVQVEDKGEVGELAQAFNAMASDLERAEQLKRNMVADVAHELRTPLSNIGGYLEAVRDGIIKPDADTIRSLEEEVTLLSRLVDELQELSLTEAGELKLDYQPEDIAELINQVVTTVQTQASAKGLSLSTDLPDKLPPVNIDSHRISQVLRNLLENAAAHTTKGDAITVTARQRGSWVGITVADT